MRKITKSDKAKLKEISIRLAGAGQVEMHRLNKEVDDILDGVKTKDSNTCLNGGKHFKHIIDQVVDFKTFPKDLS